VDALLAAWFCRFTPGSRVLDLGCGSGVIGLILASRDKTITVTGIEIQGDLAALAMTNVRANSLEKRVNIIRADVRSFRNFLGSETFECVVCNPPYGKIGTGRINVNDEAAIARHELSGNLADMLASSCFAVKNRCPVVLVYPARRFAYLMDCLTKQNLVLRRFMPVYSYPEDREAKLVLVEAVKNGGEGCKILPPLFVYRQKGGDYTEEMKMVYSYKQNKENKQKDGL
jgi:tRNA1Val (adenine37-N6)-methyltransferase